MRLNLDLSKITDYYTRQILRQVIVPQGQVTLSCNEIDSEIIVFDGGDTLALPAALYTIPNGANTVIVVSKITTETGKLIQGFAYGTTPMEKNKKDELDRVRNSVEVQYNIARENAKSIARELTSVFGGILEGINPTIEKIAKFFRELSPATKKIIGVVLIALAAIGPLMRTVGAIGQLGSMFAGARAAAIKGFRGNVVQLNESLMQTSDIALRLGGNFKKFGQDGKVFTTRKDAKRLEKLAPIIAKQDAGEELTPKEKAKRGKYIKQLAGSEAIKDKTSIMEN